MKMRRTLFAMFASTLLLSVWTNAAIGQDKASSPARGIFLALPPSAQTKPREPGTQLVQWNATFTDLTGKKNPFTMVGTPPSKAGTTTTIQVLIVPIKMVYGKTNGNKTFDPNSDHVVNGSNNTVTTDIGLSPLFNSDVNFTQGGTNLGTTQYIDAFQRGNFWYSVNKKGGKYHVLFDTTFMQEQTINVAATQGSVVTNPFGTNKVGLMDYNDFDAALHTFIAKFALINPSVLPLFVTDNIFLTTLQPNYYIGGYHSTEGAQPGGQTYSYASYVTNNGSFSQDVSALSHELGEWMDDPFTDNHVNCMDNSLMEVGDPLVNTPNFGDYPYKVGASTYHLQSLVFLGYFGGKPGTSLHRWLAFQNDMNHVCPGQ